MDQEEKTEKTEVSLPWHEGSCAKESLLGPQGGFHWKRPNALTEGPEPDVFVLVQVHRHLGKQNRTCNSRPLPPNTVRPGVAAGV